MMQICNLNRKDITSRELNNNEKKEEGVSFTLKNKEKN